MDDVDELVGRIHRSPVRTVVAVSGAGAQAVAWVLAVPGASRTLLEAIVPYARPAMVELLGHEPAEYVSAATAQAMAHASFRRALRLREGDGAVAGVACTAGIATDRPKRGDHRCHVAWHDGARDVVYGLVLAKGRRDRAGEERVVSRLLLHAVAEACAVPSELPLGLIDGERLERSP